MLTVHGIALYCRVHDKVLNLSYLFREILINLVNELRKNYGCSDFMIFKVFTVLTL
jgi:hypothetical protein